MLNETDQKFLRIAYDEAKAGFDEGGCPIGSTLAHGDKLIAPVSYTHLTLPTIYSV